LDGGYSTGGSLELARLIDRYGEVLIPDLKQYYGIDLRDVFSEVDPISPRWVLLHARNLPMGSAFVAQLRGGPQFLGWDQGRYMTAMLIDVIRTFQYVFILAHVDPKKKKPAPPEPFPLPDKTARTKVHKPGSFGFIAGTMLAQVKKRKEGGR